MLIENFSTTNWTPMVLWPDGTSQVITVVPGAAQHVPGIAFVGSNVWTDWKYSIEVVCSDSGGVEVHQGFSPEEYFVSGFCYGATLALVMAAVWMVKRGLRPTLEAAGSGQ